MKILIVDDKKVSIKLLKDTLAPYGYNISSAINGLDGLEKAQKNKFDLYIIDHLMPIMNGLQLCKNLKQNTVTTNQPIIFMTTQDITSVINLEELNGVEAIISKPINSNLLVSKVNQLLGKNSQRQSL